ncbi:transporter [Nocardia uniformis]|uniref:Transporter n=1 Tax=Nocardia uniformis TaxID=53432 RepID=A0A849C1Q7_9NOCA|nr:glycine betaine ABC transporter substrate-binding protein [Nocardia uniformis]NNH69777.1 transporter [Nocardia uniformis]
MFGATDRFARGTGFGRRLLGSVLVLALSAAAVSCTRDSAEPTIVVGAGDSDQARIIAEIYAGALARTGADTRVEERLGTRADYLADLDANSVTLVSDDTGDLLRYFDAAATATEPDKVLPALYSALPEGLIVSDPADGTDLRVTVVTASAAQLPTTLQDLASRCSELAVGINTGPSADPLRPALDPQLDVVDPLRTTYGCTITHLTTYGSDAEVREALLDGTIQAGVLSVPPAFLPGGNPDTLDTVADPDYAFRAQQILPLLRKAALTNDQLRKLNYVAGELTTADLADMVRQFREGNASPPNLARTWLDAHAL